LVIEIPPGLKGSQRDRKGIHCRASGYHSPARLDKDEARESADVAVSLLKA